MTGAQAATIAFAVLAMVGLALLMRRGWSRRAARTALWVPELPTIPVHLGEALTEPAEGVYLGSTGHDAWLERVTAHSLGDRTAAVLHVHPAGLLVARGAVADLFVPAAAIAGVARVTAFAGKVLGGHGIVAVTWRAGTDGPLIDTGLRLRHAADQDRVLAALTTLAPTATKEQE